MEKDHYISDLEHLISGLVSREERLLTTISEMDRQLTLIEDVAFVARLYALRSVRFDLEKMKAAWTNDQVLHPNTEIPKP